MKINAGQASSTLIPEYIGSDFDKVIEVADNIEYVKDVAAGIEGLPVSGYISDTPPTQPKAGATWYCTLDGRNYTWYADVDSGQWVESSPQSTADDPHLAGNIFTLWKRSAAEAGYNLVAGSFEEGGVLTSSTDVLWHKGLDSIYSWTGAYPINGYVVPPNTNPVGNANYAPRTDVVLHNQLAHYSSLMIGLKTDGTDQTDKIEHLIDIAMSGRKVVIVQDGGDSVRITRHIVKKYASSSAPMVCHINWGGVRLLGDYTIPEGVVDMGLIEIELSAHTPYSAFVSENLHIDNSAIPQTDPTTPTNRRGIGGMRVLNFGHVQDKNVYLKHCFYATGLWRGGYITWDLDGAILEDVGVKYKPTEDDTSAYDSAGDAFYIADVHGRARTSFCNVNAKSFAGKVGRAGVAYDALPNAISHDIVMSNAFFDGYNRVHHQEDGGLSTLTWTRGGAKNFGCMLFALQAQGAHRCEALDIVNVGALPYGANSGTVVTFAQSQASSTPVLVDCRIRYFASKNENGNALYQDCRTIIDPGVTVTRVASDSVYDGGSVTMYNTSLLNYTAGSFTGKNKLQLISPNYVDGIVIQNGYIRMDNVDSSNVFPVNNSGVGIPDSYSDSVFAIDAGTPSLIFRGTSHKRRFIDCKISNNVIANRVEMYGDDGIVTETISGELKDVILKVVSQNVATKILQSPALKIVATQGSAMDLWISTYASYATFSNLVLIDGKGSIAKPASNAAIKYDGWRWAADTWEQIV